MSNNTQMIVIETQSHTVRIPFSEFQVSVQQMNDRALGDIQVTSIKDGMTKTIRKNNTERKREKGRKQMGIGRRGPHCGRHKGFAKLEARREEFEEELLSLEEQGFTKNPRLNLRMIVKHNGDVTAAAIEIKEKIEIRRACGGGKGEAHQARLEVGREEYMEQLIALQDQGFENQRNNLRLMVKYNGDVSAVVEELQENRKQRRGNKGGARLERRREDFAHQIIALEEQGFTKNPRLTLRMIVKHNGDVTAAATEIQQTLEQRQAVKAQRQAVKAQRNGHQMTPEVQLKLE